MKGPRRTFIKVLANNYCPVDNSGVVVRREARPCSDEYLLAQCWRCSHGGPKEVTKMSTNPMHQETEKISVELLLSTGSSIRVNLFLSGEQRVSDLLNDDRNFIPFQDIAGQTRLVNKDRIVTAIPPD